MGNLKTAALLSLRKSFVTFKIFAIVALYMMVTGFIFYSAVQLIVWSLWTLPLIMFALTFLCHFIAHVILDRTVKMQSEEAVATGLWRGPN